MVSHSYSEKYERQVERKKLASFRGARYLLSNTLWLSN
jgi:hypothetical protein